MGALALAGGARLTGAAAAPTVPAVLAPNATVSRPLTSGEEVVLRIAVRAGDFVAVEVDQNSVDVEVSLAAPDGQILLRVDNGWGLFGPELVSAISPVVGRLGLTVRAKESQGGGVRIRLYGRRPASAADRIQVRAAALAAAAGPGAGAGPEALRRAAEALEQAAGLAAEAGDPTLEGTTLARAADLWQRLGETERAHRAYEPTPGPGGPLERPWLEAWRHYSVGLGEFGRRQHAPALVSLRSAREVWRRAADRRREAESLEKIRDCQMWLGDHPEMLTAAREAARLWELLDEPVAQVESLMYAGAVLRTMGDLQGALDTLGEGLAVARRTGLPGLEADILNQTGLVQSVRGRFQDALVLLRRAVALFQQVADHHGTAQSQAHVGEVYSQLGDFDRARAAYLEAIAEGRASGGSSLGIYLSRLGGAEAALGDASAARASLLEALALARHQEIRWIEAMVLAQLAALDQQSGRREEAVAGYRQALETSHGLNDSPRETVAILGLASALRAAGRDVEALATYVRAAELTQRLGARGQLGEAFVGIAGIEKSRGHLDEALARVEDALRIFESIRAAAPDPQLRASYLARNREAYELYVELLLEVHGKRPDNRLLARAFAASDRAHARGLDDLLASAGRDLDATLPAATKARREDLRAAMAAIQTHLLAARSAGRVGKEIEDLEAELAKTLAALEDLELEIGLADPRRGAVRTAGGITVAEVQGQLGPQTALLEYLVGGTTSRLFVVTRETLATFELPGEELLTAEVRSLRAALERPGTLERGRYERAASALFTVLIAPALDLVAGKTRLLIVPDGPLHLLPFEALLTGTDDLDPHRDRRQIPYLARRWETAFVPSASVLARLGAESLPPAHRMLAFGDPVYGPSSANAAGARAAAPAPAHDTAEAVRGLVGSEVAWPLPRLAGSTREIEAIAALFGRERSEVLLRERATEEAAKRLLVKGDFDVLHFASHALTSDTQPHLSGIVLSLDEDPTEDGLLQTYEILELDLDADLVVLSACATALGRQVRGEGLFGLTRAFLHAGARSTLTSLWPVSDRSTAELMTSLYRHLRSGEPAITALRSARLDLLASERTTHPYHWASFVLTGSPTTALAPTRP